MSEKDQDIAESKRAQTLSLEAGSSSTRKQKPVKSGRGIAFLALLLALSALSISVYIGWRAKPLEQTQPALQTGMDQLQVQFARQQARLTETTRSLDPLKTQIQSFQERELRLLNRIDSLTRKVSNIEGTSKDQWRLAEVEYLLRLANQRLLMGSDQLGAIQLLKSADSILNELDDFSLFTIREALAEDLAILKAVPEFDQESAYLRLQALNDLIPQLILLDENVQTNPATNLEEKLISPVKDNESNWQSKAKELLLQTWQSFASLFRYTANRVQPVEALLTSEQELLIRQNLRLLIEQGKLSVLAREQTVYNNSLKQARIWLNQYFTLGGSTTQAMVKEISELAQLKISPEIPDISRSLDALKEYQSKPSVTPQSTQPAPKEQIPVINDTPEQTDEDVTSEELTS